MTEPATGGLAVDSHLIAITEKRVTEDLRRSGETVHVRSHNAP